MKLKKNDSVLVVAGKDKGKTGKIRFAYPKDGKAIVEGINFQKKASRARGQVRQAGIIEREAPIDVSNLMLICKRCNKPVRVGYQFLEDGRKVRICQVCREVVE